MKGGKRFVVGQEAISQKQLDAAFVPDALLMAVARRAKAKMEKKLEAQGLIIHPDASVFVRVVMECIAVPKEVTKRA